MSEGHYVERFPPGPLGEPAIAFLLDLQDRTDAEVAQVRQGAEQLLRQQGPRYPVIFDTAKAIADLCSVRLARPAHAKPASGYVVRVTYDQRETPESLRAQCARIATWARARADDAAHDRGAVTLLWATIADYFAEAAKGPTL